jgi:hypothetical protein
MHDYNVHIADNNNTNTNTNNYFQPKMDNKFLDRLSKFIQSVESEMDIMLSASSSLQFLSYYKIIDDIISQKLTKNMIIRLLSAFDEDRTRLTKHLIPFIGYRSIKSSLPKSSPNSLLFTRDKQIFFFFFNKYARTIATDLKPR